MCSSRVYPQKTVDLQLKKSLRGNRWHSLLVRDHWTEKKTWIPPPPPNGQTRERDHWKKKLEYPPPPSQRKCRRILMFWKSLWPNRCCNYRNFSLIPFEFEMATMIFNILSRPPQYTPVTLPDVFLVEVVVENVENFLLEKLHGHRHGVVHP